MSSLRNSLHRRNHKERSQLAHRSRLGILEKHKDYTLRARDYHSKQDRLKRLKQKAAERNKDEFYFSMHRERTENGVHIQDRGNAALPTDIVKVLKSQDENYFRAIRLAGLKKIDRIKEQLGSIPNHLGGIDKGDEEDESNEVELQILRDAGIIAGKRPGPHRRQDPARRVAKHIVFAEPKGKDYALTGTPEDSEDCQVGPTNTDTHPVSMGWKATPSGPKMKRGHIANTDSGAGKPSESREQAREHRSRLLGELSARLTRDRQLRYAERELEMQKLLMGKGSSRKLKAVSRVDSEWKDDEDQSNGERRVAGETTWRPRVYRWRPERKR